MQRPGRLIVITLMLGLIGIANAAESRPAWQQESDKIVTAAKKEGEVRL
jgi:hypothetical protein